jgi:hypothetical protein
MQAAPFYWRTPHEIVQKSERDTHNNAKMNIGFILQTLSRKGLKNQTDK